MRQVWEFLGKSLGKADLSVICVFFICAIAIFYYIIKFHFSITRIIVNLVILFFGFIFAWQQPFLVEKMHVLEYGFLGWLSIRDLSKNKVLIKSILFAILFVLFITTLDEGFQKLLPYRVGELRDVITNVISGIFGVIVFLAR